MEAAKQGQPPEAAPERGMTIGEVSERFGLSQDTLRYYEKVGMIPPVTRTAGGIRSYSESDLGWVSLATCMRGAGLPVEALCEYVRLCRMGDSTLGERLELLRGQREALIERRRQIDATLERLEFKIGRYETAVKTGRFPPLSREDREKYRR